MNKGGVILQSIKKFAMMNCVDVCIMRFERENKISKFEFRY